MSAVLHVGAGFVAGLLFTLGYFIFRIMRAPGSDRSNVTNALRLIAHVIMHPGDFGKMIYLINPIGDIERLPQNGLKAGWLAHRPFWYLDKDELSEVVKTRPFV